jgi:hypothetical protein
VSEDAPNNEKELLQQELRGLGVTVNDAWEIPALRRKLTMARNPQPEDGRRPPYNGEGATVARPVVKAEPGTKNTGLVEMVLMKNYRPAGDFEIVGHSVKARLVKNAAGEMIEAEPARFVAGEMAPPPFPGVSFAGKIWAGTTIRLERDEAKAVYEKKIAERGFD